MESERRLFVITVRNPDDNSIVRRFILNQRNSGARVRAAKTVNWAMWQRYSVTTIPVTPDEAATIQNIGDRPRKNQEASQ